MAAVLLVAGCGGDDDATVAAAEAAPTPTAAAIAPSPDPTTTPATPEPTEAPTATPVPAAPLVLMPAQAVVLGLDSVTPPASLTADQVAIRSTLLGIVDTELAFEDKVAFMENGPILQEPHDGFMAVLVGLEGQIVLTEPTITIDADTALMVFSAQGPSIGTIDYELDMIRIDGRWAMTQAAMCSAASVSNVPCP